MEGDRKETVETNSQIEQSVQQKREPRYHRVELGDTLTKLAERYHTTVEKILVDNRKTYPKIRHNFIVLGWNLTV